jgi:hypothetical protein
MIKELNNLPFLFNELYCDDYSILTPPLYILDTSLAILWTHNYSINPLIIVNEINKAHQIQCPYIFNKHYSNVVWTNKCKKI